MWLDFQQHGYEPNSYSNSGIVCPGSDTITNADSVSNSDAIAESNSYSDSIAKSRGSIGLVSGKLVLHPGSKHIIPGHDHR
jgi:hypothetical protein